MEIVIADDSSLWRERIRSVLGCVKNVSAIYEAETGTEALRLIREKKPYLAILDIRMPEKNGIEVLMKIRELKLNVKVCMLTSYPYPQYKIKCMMEGADYFLSKTEDFDEAHILKILS